MKISTILDHVDSGHMALPEFQRGYVWNRDQVRGLMDSLYRRHPVGSLLVWATQSKGADHRGDGSLAPGVVKLLLDGQQRITSLYGIIRGKPPRFFDGNATAFTGLHFHLDREEFAFYSPIKMKDDPLWINVSALMRGGNDGLGTHIVSLSGNPDLAPRVGDYVGRLNRILGIRDIELYNEEVTGPGKTIDIVVDIFNRVNSGGTKLSKGDLALAKICAEWPKGRDQMKKALERWRESEYYFNLDWLLRSVNTVVTGEAKFLHLHEVETPRIQDGLHRAEKAIDYVLNAVAGRLGLDHDRVFFGRYAVPVMVHYVDRRKGQLAEVERDRLLFWYLQSAMWGRYSGSTETVIDQDLKLLEDLEGGLDRLIGEVKLWRSGLRVAPGHFAGATKGARFYPVLYLLTRVGEARDWGTGLPLKSQLLGKMSQLEVHHIFPRKILRRAGLRKQEINAVANFCFQTKDTNLKIAARSPEVYFPEIEKRHPGALASQWIPQDPSLWKVENFGSFLEERRTLLASAANEFLESLLHATMDETAAEESAAQATVESTMAALPGGIESEDEEDALVALNDWVIGLGLPEGLLSHELIDESSGESVAILDLAWPEGLQEGLSDPVAVLLNEGPATLEAANARGYRYFTGIESFRLYVEHDVLAENVEHAGATSSIN